MTANGRQRSLANHELTMLKEPKFTWGDSVLVDGKQLGSICGISESQIGHEYTVEFRDGSDEQIAENRLQAANESET